MTIFSNGKVILLGEHAVVYDRPALAMGLQQGMAVESLEPVDDEAVVEVREWNLAARESDETDLGRVIRKSLESSGGRKYRVIVRSSLPRGAGLGSSAALSVLLVKTAASIAGRDLSLGEVRQAAHEMEKLFHGSPSGLDDTLATYGGLCVFKRTGWSDHDMTGPLNGCERLSTEAIRLRDHPPTLVLAFSGETRPTKEMVRMVRLRWEQDRDQVEEWFDRIAELTRKGLKALSENFLMDLGEAMVQNHELLARLGLSSAGVDQLVEAAMSHGALGAKLTGGGGGGCVIALAPGDEETVMDAWRSMGFKAWIADREGLRD